MKKLCTLLSCILLVSCASQVDVDYRAGLDLSNIKTFQVEPKPVNASTDPRIDNPFMQQRTVEALRAGFSAKGWRDAADSADAQIKYHLVIKQEFETDDSGVYLGIGTGSRHSFFGMTYAFPDRQVASVDVLVLTIDILDAQGGLLWRGSLGRRLLGGSTPDSHRQLIQSMVAEILKQFPPQPTPPR
ncbi:MAG: DUF4136 domain-containing protein [Gammaproteobacteria bacterium]